MRIKLRLGRILFNCTNDAHSLLLCNAAASLFHAVTSKHSGYHDDSSSSRDVDEYEFWDDYDDLHGLHDHHGVGLLAGSGPAVLSGLLLGNGLVATTTESCQSAGGLCESALSCSTSHDNHDDDHHLGPVVGRYLGVCSTNGQVRAHLLFLTF